MKVFWASLLFFALILTGTVCNARYVHCSMEEMQRLLEKMDSSSASSEWIPPLEAFWAERRDRIEWTTGRRKIQSIDEELIGLKWAAKDGKENEFQKYRALLMEATEELIRQESLTFESIF